MILGLAPPEGLSARSALPDRVLSVEDMGRDFLVRVDAGPVLAVEVTPDARADLGREPGREVCCLIKTHSIRLGPARSRPDRP